MIVQIALAIYGYKSVLELQVTNLAEPTSSESRAIRENLHDVRGFESESLFIIAEDVDKREGGS